MISTLRIRVYPTVGDELILQNICDAHCVKLEIGGTTKCDGNLLGFERDPKPGGRLYRTDWFVAYLTGIWYDIVQTKLDFINTIKNS